MTALPFHIAFLASAFGLAAVVPEPEASGRIA